jgi:hypothetical protein
MLGKASWEYILFRIVNFQGTTQEGKGEDETIISRLKVGKSGLPVV